MSEYELQTIASVLERIAGALEGLLDYRLHSCDLCDGTGVAILSYEKRDSMGMDRDFTGVAVIPHALPQFQYDFVHVRTKCLNCNGTGRIERKQVPNMRNWLP